MLKGSRTSIIQYKVTHKPYDSIKSEIGFQHIGPQIDNKQVLPEFENRVEQIMATDEDLKKLDGFVVKVKDILKKLPDVKNVTEVGSYGMHTMRKCKLIADLVLEYNAMPMEAQFRKSITDNVVAQLNEDSLLNPVSVESSVRSSMQLTSCDGCWVIIFPTSLKLESTEDAVDKDHLISNQLMVKHKDWFKEHGVHDTARSLIALISDTRDRYKGLMALNPWLCHLLGQYCILNTLDRRAVPLHIAYKRFLQILASGFFLSSSQGLLDETLPGNPRAHMALTLEQQNELCCTAQTLLRLFYHGQYRKIIGIEVSDFELNSNMFVNEILIKPSEILL